MNNHSKTIQSFVSDRNNQKHIFTAGPASLLPENLTGLRPCFGRGDDDYLEVESQVLTSLRNLSGHDHIVRLQGSASLALEIVSHNFLYGNVLIVLSGHYSNRLHYYAKSVAALGNISTIQTIPWTELDTVSGDYDWVFSCYTETSIGLRLPIQELKSTATRLNARLILDATASIGLEPHHDLADVIAYSSCKGLFGLTGAAFIAYNDHPTVRVDSFYFNLSTHIDRKVTGPYHSIASLYDVLPRHSDFKQAVVANKLAFVDRFKSYITYFESYQPKLCTYVRKTITTRDPRAILYTPRSHLPGSVVCHLGEVHLGSSAQGLNLRTLDIDT